MRLTCPACDTAYEIPDRAIPVEGREVQCSVCAHAWYQLPASSAVPPGPMVSDLPGPDLAERLSQTLGRRRPDADAADMAPGAAPAPVAEHGNATATPAEPVPQEPAFHGYQRRQTEERGDAAAGPEPVQAPPRPGHRPEPAPPAAAAAPDETGAEAEPDSGYEPPVHPRRRIDPAVLAVLRAEAQHESQQRRREGAAPLETQPDLGLTPPPRKPRAAGESIRDRLARLQAAEAAAATAPARWQPGEESLDRRDRVRPAPMRVLPERDGPSPAAAPTASGSRAVARAVNRNLPVALSPSEIAVIEERRARAGFRIGFGLTAGLGAGALVLFLAAPTLIAHLPASKPVLDRIIEGGEAVQTRLAEGMRDSIQSLSGGARPDG